METNQTMLEIDAMKSVAEALKPLEAEGRARVLDWAYSHFALGSTPKRTPSSSTPTGDQLADEQVNEGVEDRTFADLADYYHAATPATEVEKALVAAMWFQEFEGVDGIDSQRVNTALKNLGHGVTNITRAFDGLMKPKPALIIQLRKSGSTKQARKTYRVTDAGKKRVQQMLSSVS